MIKSQKQITIFLLIFLCTRCLLLDAQHKFTTKCLLMKDGILLDSTNAPFRIDIIDENYNVSHFEALNPFICELDINCTYQFVFFYPDCQPRRVQIDTHSSGLEKWLYTFKVDLKTSLIVEPIYSGNIFYNKETSQFDFHKN